MRVKQETELPKKKKMELSEIDTETGTKLSDGILEEAGSDGIEPEFEFPDSPGNTPNQIIQGMQGAEVEDPEPKRTVNRYL